MILDAQNRFSDAQAVTVTALSTNAIDIGPLSHAKNSQGSENHMEILLHINTTFTAAGAATLTVQCISSANANLSSPVIHDVSDALAVAELVAGSKVRFKPRVPIDAGRYIGLNYVVATGPMTAGALSAYVPMNRQTNQ